MSVLLILVAQCFLRGRSNFKCSNFPLPYFDILWLTQFRHVVPAMLKWTLHHGRSRLNSVNDVDRFDMVITSYATIASEWRRLDENSSPMFATRWHRIVLDEGQWKLSTPAMRADLMKLTRSVTLPRRQQKLFVRSKLMRDGRSQGHPFTIG